MQFAHLPHPKGMQDLEQQILEWLALELESNEGEESAAVPIHLLLVKLALRSYGDKDDLSKSTQISLESFGRRNLYLTLRRLYSKGLIEFVRADGSELLIDERHVEEKEISEDERRLKFVTLTENGVFLALGSAK